MTPSANEARPARPKAEGFPRAPLIEALIDIQFSEPLTEEETERARNALQGAYPSFVAIPHIELQFDIENDALEVEGRETRFRGDGADPSEVVLLQPRGMSTSQLAPYRDWSELYARFRRDWATITSATRIRGVRRVAVRSINRIDVAPHGRVVRYEDYLTLHPHLPRGLDPVSDFGMQVITEIPEIEGIARIAVSGAPPAVEGKASFLLDIDLSRTANLPAEPDAFDSIFSEFRRIKNDLYRTCLTPHALREFDE